MKTLVIPRHEVPAYEDLFRQIGSVGRGETEDRDTFLKFKYAVGRNYKKCESVHKATDARVDEIMRPEPRFQNFLRARDELCDRFATKDDAGKVVLTPDKNDPNRMHRTFTPENQAAGEEALKELRETFAEAIREHDQQEEVAKKYLDETVEIELYAVPFSWVAERLAGAWIEAIDCMLIDAPDIEAEAQADRMRTIPANPGNISLVVDGEPAPDAPGESTK